MALLLMQPNHFMQVLRLEAEQLPALGDHDVLINVLAVGRQAGSCLFGRSNQLLPMPCGAPP